MTEEKFRELVGIAIGEASMLWSERPTGVFESTKAIAIMERIIEAAQLLTPKDSGEDAE